MPVGDVITRFSSSFPKSRHEDLDMEPDISLSNLEKQTSMRKIGLLPKSETALTFEYSLNFYAAIGKNVAS